MTGGVLYIGGNTGAMLDGTGRARAGLGLGLGMAGAGLGQGMGQGCSHKQDARTENARTTICTNRPAASR